METKFNVAIDPWIPVVDLTGNQKLISLKSVFTEGENYADLAVRPHERVSLMRLFLCVAHAALNGPNNYDEWLKVPAELPEKARTYLTTWKDWFELFHPTKPWLQVAGLNLLPSDKDNKDNDSDDEKGWSKLSKLCCTKASGNNSTLFDHTANGNQNITYKKAEITLNLLTFQNFFVAGGKASSRLWDTIKMENPKNPTGGPCSGKSILYTFLRGKNIFESLHLNLNTFDDLKFVYGSSNDWIGKPIWEMPIKSPDDQAAIDNATKTHIGRLVPQTRILRINEDCQKVLFGAGFVYPKFQDENDKKGKKKEDFYPDLFSTTVVNKKSNDRKLLQARPDIAIWRELHSLLVHDKDKSSKARGPLCLRNFPDSGCDIVTNAMMTNPKHAADIVDLLESVFYIPSHLQTSEGISIYESEVKKSERLASRLGGAIETYRKKIDGGWEGRLKSAGKDQGELKAKLYSIATTHYWTTVEKNLSLLWAHIEAIGTTVEQVEATQKAWRAMLFKTALDAYSLGCGQETPRQIKAFAKGWQALVKPKDETQNKNKEDEE